MKTPLSSILESFFWIIFMALAVLIIFFGRSIGWLEVVSLILSLTGGIFTSAYKSSQKDTS